MTERYQPVIRIQGGLSEADRKEFYRLRLYREAFAMALRPQTPWPGSSHLNWSQTIPQFARDRSVKRAFHGPRWLPQSVLVESVM